ncbi:sulfotransferase 2A, ARABIDOPSIS THALIANA SULFOTRANSFERASE 2A [Hibiscus trionum]|uniref:Sulfotransferase n=1 Tax=Hibiscus trionum TaxID=183268 RepID=A0A9W7HM46_HIBTR|nr:sulfotransferase 2A, ARABIDOPSIS THALIANA SULFOTRANSFERASE 2A [Hibiscus trionum]
MADQSNQRHPKKHTLNSTHFQGFWCPSEFVPNIISFQNHFQALDDDIVLASKPKAGTTWLKSLAFTILNRHRFPLSVSPLNTTNPHDLILFFELSHYRNGRLPDFAGISSPRLFSTHLPYHALAESIKQSNARIVYITRNPLDIMVSQWHFVRSMPELADWPLDACLERFCRGEEAFGAFWDHVSGYWKQSMENPRKVLFLKYEEMKENPVGEMKKMAEFMGCPFSVEEEKAEAIEEIAEFCSLSNLKNLKVNKNGAVKNVDLILQTRSFFRKGEAGDYVNFLSPEAAERYSKIVEEKLKGSGLTIKMCC